MGVKCTCLRKCFRAFRKSNLEELEQGHRLIYYGDVPTIASSNDEYLRELALIKEQNEETGDSKNNLGVYNVPTNGTLQSKRRSIAQVPAKERTQTFPNNLIISSRYTAWNFLPKNLLEQFRRIVNVYFLIMAIIQSSISSPVHPMTAALPLIFVISTTAIKQGYEDWLRHKADKNVNDRPVCVVRDQQLVVIKSRDVKVGDILRLEGEDQVPADLLLVGSSDEFLRCQITTANLDGETNLKMRYCPAGLVHFKHERDFSKLHVVVECDQPNTSLYEFNGCLLVPPNRMPTSRTSESVNSFAQTNKEPTSQAPLNSTPPAPRKSSDLGRKLSTSSDPENVTISNFFTVPLSMENMVLRGARVKNTEFIFGLVIYTGKDTRLAQNSKQTSLKFSTIDKQINRYLYVFIAVLASMVVFSTGFHYYWEYSHEIDNAIYIEPDIDTRHGSTGSMIGDGLEVFASFLIIFNYIIPISLYVTVELQKFFDSKYFVWDEEMTCPVSKHPPLCNTSDLNEELGQVEYLFTDKTGTLTENIMQFRHCSVGGKNYDFIDNTLFLRDPEEPRKEPLDLEKDPEIVDFLRVLALCHSVQLMPIRRASFESTNPASKSPLQGLQLKNAKARAASSLVGLGSEPAVGILGKWEYQASSPDEKALLESCYRLDVKYLGEKEDDLTLDVLGKIQNFKRHFVLEFDADRKCMSVIVENSDGEIWLFSKGAESAIIPRCDYGPTKEVLKSVVDFAMMGMRTLAVARRQLTRDELLKFSHKLKAARRLINGRDEAMKELYRSVESHLTCVGATGVEDQLQEGVPEALQALNAAGIRIWMLTGDKIETGVSVGVACGLITPSSRQFFVTSITEKETIIRKLEEIKSEVIPEDNTTLIIDGSSLEVAFTSCPELLRDVALLVFRVVCCRMAPLQKAQVVNMVKQSKNSPITAAVGDGANDVAMIQEAHIGIGILGKEGRQAARCADFALARSAFIKKAILVHGHWFYVRLAVLVIYFFYKNIVFIGPQFIYCFYSAFSTQSLYDGMSLMMYNIFYTSCPIFTYGLQEQPYSSSALMKHPFLYRSISRNRLLAWGEFIKWCLFAVWHSLVCFYIPYYTWDFFSPVTDWSSFGTLSFCCVIGVVNMKIALETKFVSVWTLFSHCFSYGTMLIFCSFYSEANPDGVLGFLDPGEYRHVYFSLLGHFPFWIVIFLVQFVALAPDLLYKVYSNSSFRFYKLWRCVPKVKSSSVRDFHKPLRLSMLFTRRSGRVAAVSTATLQSYLSREDIT